MSVIMTLWAQGDPDELERRAAQNPDAMRAIADRAKEHGMIAHRFYGSEGQILVVDEWPDRESFQRFFDSMRSEIDSLMRALRGEYKSKQPIKTSILLRSELPMSIITLNISAAFPNRSKSAAVS